MLRVDIPVPSVVVLIGASGAGKSSFARAFFGPTEILSSDRFPGACCRRRKQPGGDSGCVRTALFGSSKATPAETIVRYRCDEHSRAGSRRLCGASAGVRLSGGGDHFRSGDRCMYREDKSTIGSGHLAGDRTAAVLRTARVAAFAESRRVFPVMVLAGGFNRRHYRSFADRLPSTPQIATRRYRLRW